MLFFPCCSGGRGIVCTSGRVRLKLHGSQSGPETNGKNPSGNERRGLHTISLWNCDPSGVNRLLGLNMSDGKNEWEKCRIDFWARLIWPSYVTIYMLWPIHMYVHIRIIGNGVCWALFSGRLGGGNDASHIIINARKIVIFIQCMLFHF